MPTLPGLMILAPVREPGERHVGVPADHGHHLIRQPGQDLRPPIQARVDDHHLLVVARRGVTEDDLAEAVHREGHRVREPRQPVHVVGAELPGRPRRDRVAHVSGLAAGQLDQLPVRVAPDPGHPVTKPEQPVEHRHRLRASGDVPGEDDAFGVPDGGLGQHGVQRG
jgi:hypothetical protein